MKVLALYTGTHLGGLALLEGESLLAEVLLEMHRTHSERLLPTLEDLLHRLGRRDWRPDLVAVAHGPGAFTSLRIGVTAAKAMAYGWKVPVQGVSTLDAIAFGLRQSARPVLILLGAREEEVYAGYYEPAPEETELGHLRPAREPVCLPLSEALQGVAPEALIVGEGIEHYQKEIVARLGGGVQFADAAAAWCHPSAVGILALRRQRQRPVSKESAFELAPLYLRRSAPERRMVREQLAERSS
ncbi:MAG: tRNA (adenosine(37)-N6)-threonylcarbamoyltransferase complex dimerization subunit type 1 TsaB [Candidatus Poribacteria bacterium]|nr:MAG: tRNA (adenosine(37)-N6)-threonylcarbamoyltransferase complex dimerization subunit type 1 TsaB [Candidatus Poribacteria bacterium]